MDIPVKQVPKYRHASRNQGVLYIFTQKQSYYHKHAKGLLDAKEQTLSGAQK